MQAEGMAGRIYDECLPFVRESLQDRMQWVWTENIDIAYEAARKEIHDV